MEITNSDGTVSFQDVTQYSNREKSFFGAKDANRMNEALNTIMSMVENGTDLYTAFQNYFALQKEMFEEKATNTNNDFTSYVNGLKAEGDKTLETIKTNYRQEVTDFKEAQEKSFNIWFDLVRGQLSGDVAGNLLNQIESATERVRLIESMCLTNDFIAPIATDDDTLTFLTDDQGNVLLADWKYKEV
ncbi:hypothetical protein [Ruthenibacterium lactatiformans]|uniref:hypothetical protein n=1 Tax=Ruthenibacterium lactatiformans TaxID=1550024 RepID=UPI002495A50F|nr:hypothetical protein [Ruthenibacterium lactatiformans]